MVHLCGKRYVQRAGEEREIKVYTNQDRVILYMNGEVVGDATPVDHVARFTVAMKEGENLFMVVAGECKDTMTLEKVDVEPEIYTLQGQESGEDVVANWFIAAGELELEDAPMEFPEGKLSIKSTVGEIYKNEGAWEFFSKMTKGRIAPEAPMWNMMENMTFEMIMDFGGDVPESFLKTVNQTLNQFEKVE